MQDIFYDVPKAVEAELLYEAKDKADSVFRDELDCSKSFARVGCTKSFDEIYEIYKKSGFQHFVFIRRESSYEDHLEVGIRCSGDNGIDYFIFIELSRKYEDYFINKYKLKKN